MRRIDGCHRAVKFLAPVIMLFAMLACPLPVAGDDGVQVNSDGFGSLNCNSIWAMVEFQGELYTGTGSPGKLFRTDGTTAYASERYVWYEVALPMVFDSVGEFEIQDITAMTVFETPVGPYLYIAASGRDSVDGQYKSALFRSNDGRGWDAINSRRTREEGSIVAMEQFGRYLYISVGDNSRNMDPSLFALLRTDGGALETLTTNVLMGDGDNYFGDLQVYNGHLYAGTSGNNDVGADRTSEVWRTMNGTHWRKVADLYSPTMAEIESMEVFQDSLYVGAKNHPGMGEDNTAPELWRSYDGLTWEKVDTEDQFDPLHLHVDSLLAFEDYLFAGMGGGGVRGPKASIYKSVDGLNWLNATPSGLASDGANYLIGSMVVSGDHLYAGTGYNTRMGAEIWRLEPFPPAEPAIGSGPGPAGTLALIGCGPCPACFERACDPRVNPEHDLFLIWDPLTDIAQSFSRTEIGLKPADGPLGAAAPVVGWNEQPAFVVSAPYADGQASNAGSILFLDQSGATLTRIDGAVAEERFGLDLDVRGDRTVAVSVHRLLYFVGDKLSFEMEFSDSLQAQMGIHVGFTADVDGDGQAEILLGAPYTTAVGLKEAGKILLISSDSGEILDSQYGRKAGQHLGESLQTIDLHSGLNPRQSGQ